VTYGNYTIQITTPSGRGGVGLAELYELDANGRTVNLSTRARVGTGDGVLIGGLRGAGARVQTHARARSGTDARRLRRGGRAGRPGADRAFRHDPRGHERSLGFGQRHRGKRGEQECGGVALAAGTQDAALLITLPPGAYTWKSAAKNNTQGVALLEIYESTVGGTRRA